jgi:hypothetical protein
MAAGYVAFAHRMNWVDHMGAIDGAPGIGDTVMHARDTFFRNAHFRAWRCFQCKVILMDYGAGPQYTPLTEGSGKRE